MSDSDTGETSRFKIKHIEPGKNVADNTNSRDNSQNASNSQNDDNQTLFTAAAQKVYKHKKRKNKRQRESSPESSSSDSGESVEEGNSTESHFKLYLNLRVTNGSFLVKRQIMSVTSLIILFQKRM